MPMTFPGPRGSGSVLVQGQIREEPFYKVPALFCWHLLCPPSPAPAPACPCPLLTEPLGAALSLREDARALVQVLPPDTLPSAGAGWLMGEEQSSPQPSGHTLSLEPERHTHTHRATWGLTSRLRYRPACLSPAPRVWAPAFRHRGKSSVFPMPVGPAGSGEVRSVGHGPDFGVKQNEKTDGVPDTKCRHALLLKASFSATRMHTQVRRAHLWR